VGAGDRHFEAFELTASACRVRFASATSKSNSANHSSSTSCTGQWTTSPSIIARSTPDDATTTVLPGRVTWRRHGVEAAKDRRRAGPRLEALTHGLEVGSDVVGMLDHEVIPVGL
jgi:hypothetical protein